MLNSHTPRLWFLYCLNIPDYYRVSLLRVRNAATNSRSLNKHGLSTFNFQRKRVDWSSFSLWEKKSSKKKTDERVGEITSGERCIQSIYERNSGGVSEKVWLGEKNVEYVWENKKKDEVVNINGESICNTRCKWDWILEILIKRNCKICFSVIYIFCCGYLT